MRALWLIRGNLTQHPGGDTTQILQTSAALQAFGVEVTLCADPAPKMRGYDIVHLFHLDRSWENEPHCRRLRREGRPAVLSTIYWPADQFDRQGRAGFQGVLARAFGSGAYQNLRLAQRWLLHALSRPSASSLSARAWGFFRAVRYVLESVAAILPNSQAEREQIVRKFGVERPAVIVPNAADNRTFRPPAAESDAGRDGVLCVGRIEPRKNQLTLIEALRDRQMPLTLVGQPGRYSRAYYRRCLRAAGGRPIRFLPQQPPESLCRLYQQARVHACVSWYETPGLASLEAALCGCNLVVTPGGCTHEYFGDQAVYCDPVDRDSIRQAIELALKRPSPTSLQRRVAEEFTWETAAQKTLEGYRLALAGGG